MKLLNQFFLQSFDIRKEEMKSAVLLQSNIFFIILTYITLKPTVNALFLSKFGVQHLPYVFVLLALFAGIISLFYSKLLSKVSLHKVMMYTNLSGVFFMLVFGILLQLRIAEGIVLYLFYIWLAIFAVLATSQFWMLTNIVFSVREAKRLFGFIGAGAILGGILGGYLASFLANIISSKNIVFAAAVFLGISTPISHYLWRNQVVDKLTQFQQKKRLTHTTSNPFSIVRKSKYLSLIAGIVGLSVIVSKLIDYQFSAMVTSTIKNPDELTAFFGFWFSTFNIISLIIQLFIMRKIVGVYGVGTSLLVLPTGIAMAAVLVLFFPVLWVAIFLQMNDASLKNSLNRSAIELLSLPIPLEVKSRVKTFIDVFVDRGATGLAGILLIFVIKGLQLPSLYINITILLLITFWIYLVYQIRTEYLKTIQIKLGQETDNNKTEPFNINNTSVLGGITKVLENGKEKQILYILSKVYELKDKRLFPVIKKLLKHESAQVRAAALQNLYLFTSPKIIDEVIPMINDDDVEVKIKAMEYLIARDPENCIALINELIKHEDYQLNGAALTSLAIQSRNNPEMGAIFKIEQLIQEKIDYLKMLDITKKEHYTINILKATGNANLPKFYSFIVQNLKNENDQIAKIAIEAAGNTLNPLFVDELLNCLADNNLKDSSSKALANFGKEIINVLSIKIKNPETNIDIIRKIPLVVEKLGSQSSVDFLFNLLHFEDVTVRLESLRGLNELKIKYPFLDVNKKEVIQLIMEEGNLYLDTLKILNAQNSANLHYDNTQENIYSNAIVDARKSLTKILESRLDGTLERIFRLLGLRYPPEEILNIYEGIQQKNSDFRSNALEYLDNLLDINLKRILMPVIETALIVDGGESADQIELKIPNEYQAFEMLMAGKDIKIKLAVLYLVEQLKDDKFLPLLKPYLEDKNEKIRTFAQRAAGIPH